MCSLSLYRFPSLSVFLGFSTSSFDDYLNITTLGFFMTSILFSKDMVIHKRFLCHILQGQEVNRKHRSIFFSYIFDEPKDNLEGQNQVAFQTDGHIY